MAYCNEWQLFKWLKEAHVTYGASLEDLKDLVTTARNWTELRTALDDFFSLASERVQ